MTSHLWCQPLLDDHPNGLVPTSELFACLLAERATPWCLTGIAQVGDPFLIDLGDLDKGAPFAALELDGVTLVALEDAGDNGTSECETWLVVKGTHLQTRLPHVSVRIQVSSASATWDNPRKNPVDNPVLLAMVADHTDERVLDFGTSFEDAYYPLVGFDYDVVAMDKAARMAMQDRLEDVLPSGTGTRNKPRL